MKHLLTIAATILWGLWFGGLVTLFILVQTLFRIDREMAVEVAPRMFIAFEMYQYGLAALALAVFVVWTLLMRSRMAVICFALVAATGLLALLSGMVITPRLELLRAEELRGTPEFGRWHNWSLFVYLTQTLLLLIVGLLLPRTRPR